MRNGDVYLVTQRLDLADHARVDALERNLGIEMPQGYRELVTTFGNGEFCSILSIHQPDEIFQNRNFLRSTFAEHHFWDEMPDDVSEEDLLDSAVIASTSNGDYYSIRISEPQRIFFLPRGASKVSAVDARKIELMDLYWMTDHQPPPAFRYFDSSFNRAMFEVVCQSPTLKREELVQSLMDCFSIEEHHREDYFFDTHRVIWLFFRAIQGYVYIDSAEQSAFVQRVAVQYDKDLSQRLHDVRKELTRSGFIKMA